MNELAIIISLIAIILNLLAIFFNTDWGMYTLDKIDDFIYWIAEKRNKDTKN